MENFALAQKLGSVACLICAVYLWTHGEQNGWVIFLGVIGAIGSM